MPSVADLVDEPRLRELVDDNAELQRGRALADGGAVRFGNFGPLAVTAEVDDGYTHSVELASTPQGLRWSCSCNADGFCVHATAAAIETWRRSP
jgi:uncharacterized Zn finger protein